MSRLITVQAFHLLIRWCVVHYRCWSICPWWSFFFSPQVVFLVSCKFLYLHPGVRFDRVELIAKIFFGSYSLQLVLLWTVGHCFNLWGSVFICYLHWDEWVFSPHLLFIHWCWLLLILSLSFLWLIVIHLRCSIRWLKPWKLGFWCVGFPLPTVEGLVFLWLSNLCEWYLCFTVIHLWFILKFIVSVIFYLSIFHQ